MANTKVTVRKVNKGVEQPVCVRYSHPDANGKNQDFFAPTGISLDPALLKNGRVVGDPTAPEMNERIQQVVSAVEMAQRVASTGGRQPYAGSVKAEYRRLERAAPKLRLLAEEIKAGDKTDLETLEMEIEQLLAQIEEKRSKIVLIQKRQGTYQPELLGQLIDDYVAHRKAARPKNATGKRKGSFSESLAKQYKQLKDQLCKYNPTLSIRDIDKIKMYDIEDYYVHERFFNSSIETHLNKLVTVLNYYQVDYKLSKSYKDYKFELKKREESVIYLTTEELRAFRQVTTAHRSPLVQQAGERAKDLALFMSESALRYSDSAVTRADIKNGYIVKEQKKTGHEVYIPFTRRLQSICEKYDYKLKGGKLGLFNTTFRRLLKSLPVTSLHEPLTVVNYIGSEAIEDTRPKWQHCAAHTLRRTMINQMLLRGKRYDQITKVTGHQNFETFQTYVDRDMKVAEMDEVFNFLDEQELIPLMSVA